ncbi:MAG: cohesin domain-containing protein, partial [Patescibacteria group bacterium]
QAAILYLAPDKGEYHQGDTFIMAIRIDAEGECINAVQADLKFPQEVLSAVDFSQGGSILNFWAAPPVIDENQGLISFSGGSAGGYCGKIPGDPGESNILGKIIFSARGGSAFGGKAKVEFLETSQVLLNDGLGTSAKLSSKGSTLTILPGVSSTPKQEWQEELAKDSTPPEIFKIEINQVSSAFNGKYFIIFFTTDRQTGLDYYEVKEGERDWVKTAGPYVLKDQGLRSIIKVRAVDKAGNHITVEQLPQNKPLPYKYFIAVAVLILIIGGIILFFVRRNRLNHE